MKKKSLIFRQYWFYDKMSNTFFYDENNNAAKTAHFLHPWGTIDMRVGHNCHGELKKILVEKNIGWYPNGNTFVQKN